MRTTPFDLILLFLLEVLSGLALVVGVPDLLLLSGLDQLLAEVGVGDGDQRLGTLPGGQALQVYAAVFGDHIHGVDAGIGNDAALGQGGTDAGRQGAVLLLEGRGQADEALAAVGKVCAQNKVHLHR